MLPGFTQWVNAMQAARSAIEANSSDEEVLTSAKLTGAFSGQMRRLFVEELDSVGFHEVMGVSSSAAFFEAPASSISKAS